MGRGARSAAPPPVSPLTWANGCEKQGREGIGREEEGGGGNLNFERRTSNFEHRMSRFKFAKLVVLKRGQGKVSHINVRCLRFATREAIRGNSCPRKMTFGHRGVKISGLQKGPRSGWCNQEK
jgi:hypothetical protein